jgi:hypothetical protein
MYRLKQPREDGTTHVVLTPRSFLTRLSWLIAPPGSHLTRYHGVFAPHHPWRPEIVSQRATPQPPAPPPSTIGGAQERSKWALLMRRVLGVEVLLCPLCAGQRRVVAEIPEGPIAKKILEHLGLPSTAPKPAQGALFSTGPPPVDHPEASVDWPNEDYDQRLPGSEWDV